MALACRRLLFAVTAAGYVWTFVCLWVLDWPKDYATTAVVANFFHRRDPAAAWICGGVSIWVSWEAFRQYLPWWAFWLLVLGAFGAGHVLWPHS